MKIAKPWLLCATALLTGQALATPLDGVYSGTTSQGQSIEFTVSNAGTSVTSILFFANFTCSFGVLSSGLGTDPQATITNDAFLWRSGITPGVGINAGASNAIIVNATFAGNTASGMLNWVRPVFRGSGAQTEACTSLGSSFTASLIGPASVGTERQPGVVTTTQSVQLK